VASALLSNILSHRQIGQFVRERELQEQRQGTTSTPNNPGTTLSPNNPVVPPGVPLPGAQPQPPPPPGPRNLNWSFVIAGFLGLALALILSYTLSDRISKPLSKLAAATRGIARGDYGERAHVSGGVEVEELEEAFNSLAESLERNEKLRNNRVEDVAHELRNPLATLRGQLELLQDGRIECDRELVDSLMEDATLLSRLVEDLRQLSMVEAGQLQLDLEQLGVEEALRDVASRFENEASMKKTKLGVELAPDLPPIKADRTRLAQVLGNLVGNSITHTQSGGSIEVGAGRIGDDVVISVTDDGAGIDSEELPFVFERFYRADRSRTRETGGAGLGLSIAKSLVEAQGGSIWAESEGAGKGTAVHFTLPVFSSNP
jgi:signal transduction histidine kinase